MLAGLILLAGGVASWAANGTWTADSSGNWSDTTKWAGGTVADGDTYTADFSTVNITADRTVTLDAGHTLSVLKFGDVTPDHNWILSGANTLTLGTTPSINVLNQTATISSVIAGTAFTKIGAGTLVLNGSAVNTFTGTLSNNVGVLTEDFSNLSTPTDLINNGVILSLGGGTLNINGKASGATSQTFASTTFASGGNLINVVNNGTSATLSLGALSYPAHATVEYNTSGNSTITTTSAGGGPLGLVWNNYATFGLVDWASTDTSAGGVGTSPYTNRALSTVTGGYVTTMGGTGQGINLDLQANVTAGGNIGAQTVRFNTPAATNINVNGKWAVINAVLVSTNMGAVNCSIGNGNWFANYNTAAANEWVVQNNTLGYFTIGSLINDRGGAGALTYVQSGSGTVVMPGTSTVSGAAGNSANNYTGQSYLNGGFTVCKVDADLGAPTTAALVNLNGGTVVGNATFALDSNGSGANPRPFVLGNNGGGLAATAGNTMTVDGIISNATAGVGALTIGIAASSANGNVQGQLPGSGASTANTTPVSATGTVALTGANTYTGGTILQNAVLSFASGSLGTGGITFNGGTLQWNANTTDISSQTVAIGAGGATLDVNGNTVTLAGSIGSGGSGALTVTNSGANGGLYLNGGSSYTGGTTVASGGTLGSTNTLAGNVTWSTGAFAALTQGSPMTVSGTVTLNNTTVKVIASGLTTGTYTLLTASGGITGGSTVNSTPSGSGIVAGGYAGAIAISGNTVVLHVTQLGVSAVWTDGGANQFWTNSANWSGGVPHNAGDSATFGSGGMGLPVNLNANETVGVLAFTNAVSYIITNANNTLTLDNSAHGASVTVTAGISNAINTALSLNDSTAVNVSPGTSVAFGGNVANKSVPETVTVSGGGTVVLSGANSYGPSAGTVGTTLNGATIQVKANAALGAGDVSTTDNSTLQAGAANLTLANNFAIANTKTATVDNNGNNATLLGVISGNGALTKIGTGTLTLAGGNTYVGNTTINGGALSISSPANVVSPNIILNGGDLLGTGTFAVTNNLQIGLSSGSAIATGFLDAASSQTLTINSPIVVAAGNTGVNNLTVNSGAGNNGMVILGATNTFNGTNIIVAGVEQLASPLALENSILNYNNQGGTLDFGALTTVTLGGLTGSQNLTLVNDSSAAVALRIGNNNTAASYSGTLGDSGAGATLNKEGTNTIIIGSASGGGASYSGATTVNNGTLVLDGNGAVSMNTSSNIRLDASLGASALNLVDSANVTTSGGVYLGSEPTGGSDGGNGYPWAWQPAITATNSVTNGWYVAPTLEPRVFRVRIDP